MTEEKKQEMKDLKKTVEAHKTLSEEESEKKADDAKEVAKEMIEDKLKEEEAEKEKRDKELTAKFEAGEMSKRELLTEKKKYEEIDAWVPKTKIGRDVKEGIIKSLDEILDKNLKILESEIPDKLSSIKTDLISIGQAKGKFGGGKRRAWRQTQKKTKEGNVLVFSAMAVAGDEDGHIGIGVGRAKETLPARDKATRKAKLNLIKIERACAGFDCDCSEKHTIPMKVEGKEGSSKVILMPAPQGTGLVVGEELKKLLKLAGIKDVYSKSYGNKRTTFNLVKACFNALKKTQLIKQYEDKK